MSSIYRVTASKIRLDKFLVEQLSGFSRTEIQRLIALGLVQVNGVVVTSANHAVREGDAIAVQEQTVSGAAAVVHLPEVPVLYNNHGLLIIDKPAGLSVHAGAGVKGVTLTDVLAAQFPELQGVGEAHRPGIVHRLDKDTSGVMLVAKTALMYEFLKNAFAERKVKKQYIALVKGVPSATHAFIDTPIGRDPKDFRKYTTKNPVESKPSVTEYHVLEELSVLPASIDKMALISVNLHTGRTHQIRVHMASVGHPLVGDSLYGGKSVLYEGVSRQFLHARRVEVQLPDGTWIEAESNLPSDLRNILEGLRCESVDSL